MIYRAIGIISDSNTAGISISFNEFTAIGNKWQYSIIAAEQFVYDSIWVKRLSSLKSLSVEEYLLLNKQFGTYIGDLTNNFIDQNSLQHQVQLISFEGHFLHFDESCTCTRFGDGATLAAKTGLSVIVDLHDMDEAFGGNGGGLFEKAERVLFNEDNKKNLEEKEAEKLGTFKETLMVAMLGVLRWREEATVSSLATGAKKSSIGGALWLGNDA